MTTAAQSGDVAVSRAVLRAAWRSEQRAASTARRAGDPDGMWLATRSISSNRARHPTTSDDTAPKSEGSRPMAEGTP